MEWFEPGRCTALGLDKASRRRCNRFGSVFDEKPDFNGFRWPHHSCCKRNGVICRLDRFVGNRAIGFIGSKAVAEEKAGSRLPRDSLRLQAYAGTRRYDQRPPVCRPCEIVNIVRHGRDALCRRFTVTCDHPDLINPSAAFQKSDIFAVG